jgi:hypothetical protein
VSKCAVNFLAKLIRGISSPPAPAHYAYCARDLSDQIAREPGVYCFNELLSRAAAQVVGFARDPNSWAERGHGAGPAKAAQGHFCPLDAAFGHRSLPAFLQFPFPGRGDWFENWQRPVRRMPMEMRDRVKPLAGSLQTIASWSPVDARATGMATSAPIILDRIDRFSMFTATRCRKQSRQDRLRSRGRCFRSKNPSPHSHRISWARARRANRRRSSMQAMTRIAVIPRAARVSMPAQRCSWLRSSSRSFNCSSAMRDSRCTRRRMRRKSRIRNQIPAAT